MCLNLTNAHTVCCWAVKRLSSSFGQGKGESRWRNLSNVAVGKLACLWGSIHLRMNCCTEQARQESQRTKERSPKTSLVTTGQHHFRFKQSCQMGVYEIWHGIGQERNDERWKQHHRCERHHSIPSSEQHIVTTCYISKTTHERPRVSIRLSGRLHESQGTPLIASKRLSGLWHWTMPYQAQPWAIQKKQTLEFRHSSLNGCTVFLMSSIERQFQVWHSSYCVQKRHCSSLSSCWDCFWTIWQESGEKIKQAGFVIFTLHKLITVFLDWDLLDVLCMH